MDDLLRLLLLQDANTRVVLLGTALLGMASGVVGSFAVLRRRALVGDALAHAALPGICLAFFVVGDRNVAAFLLGALVFGVLGVLVISLVRTYTRVKEDAAIGIVLSSFFGLGIVLSSIIQHLPSGNRAGLDTFIFGKAATMVRQDALFIGVIAGAVLTGVALLFKELRLLCFDRDFAASQGWPVLRLDLFLMAMICLCTIVGLPAVGVVLMAALLIIPGVAARFWTEKLGRMVVVSGAFGLASGLFGTALSATLPGFESSLSRGQPTGPVIALTAAALFLLSMFAAPRRGLVAAGLRRLRLRRRISLQNLLRTLYELADQPAGVPVAFSREQVHHHRGWTRRVADLQIARAAARGLVQTDGGTVRLTPAGQSEAARIVRAHRLWELFLIDNASIAPDHVDRDADEIEHVLPPDLLERLEARLHAEGRLPALPAEVPRSPHRLREAST